MIGAPRLAVALALLLAIARAPQATSWARQTGWADHAVVLSLDGARADATRAVMPVDLADRAAVTWTAQTVSPSTTLPAHTSMLSGLPPEVHGVRFNDWRQGQPYFGRPTVFTEVTRAGGRAVAIVHKPKLLMLAPPGAVASAQHLPYPTFLQGDVVEVAARRFVEQRPAFLFVHVADPDDMGHAHGWMSEPYMRVMAGVPGLIDRLQRAFGEAGVVGRTLLIVTSDHGGHDRTHGTTRWEDMTIPWMAFGSAVRAGIVLERRVVVYDTAATVLAALGMPVPEGWRGRPVTEVVSSR